MSQEKQVFSTTINGSEFTVEVGELAKQANGACMIQYGDTSVLATVTASKEPKDLPFFPLTVNYEERLYAVGKIPGGFIKREGRPSDKAILSSRLIDRPIRPLFPEGFRNEVQVISTVMSVDQDCSAEIAAMIGSSIALSNANIPFKGPIAGVHVGRVDGEFIINPTIEEQEHSDLELTVAGTKHAINMVEAGANELSEEVILDAIMFAHDEIVRLVQFQEEIVKETGKEKSEVEVFTIDSEIQAKIKQEVKEKLVQAVQIKDKQEREEQIQLLNEETLASYDDEENEEVVDHVKAALDELLKNEVRRLIT